MSKRLNAIGLAASALAGLAAAGYYYLFRRPLPQTSGELRLVGLKNPVEVYYDQWGIPHIYAQNEQDLLFAQGYIHAQDRLWQMEFNRRLVAGRLSEILGEVALPLDRWVRILGMRRTADQESQLLTPELHELLGSYAAGVNARISAGKLPVEFSLLRFRPSPWEIADTLSWTKMMSWTLSVNWETELLRARLVERVGAERAAELEPDYRPEWPRVLSPDVDFVALGKSALERAAAARPFSGPSAPQGLGSNNWAVAGSRSTTGKPLFASDMHLAMTIPSIWYENHLEGGEWRLSGVTFPGIPGIVAGHNQHVAWGFTNGFADVQDLYLERLMRLENGEVLYEYQGEWLPAQLEREVIQVKGGKQVIEEVVVTRHGPVINELAQDLSGETPLALRWTSHEPACMFQALLDMARARNCQEFHQALRHWHAPVQNVVYADTEGNIGYTLAGKIPIRAKGDGRLPAPGWKGEYEWSGYIPFEELPHLDNPPNGILFSANNRVATENYAHFLGYDHVSGNRAQRIAELLDQREKIDLAYIQQMQFDQVSPHARLVACTLSELQTSDPELEIVVRRMRNWDGSLGANSPEAAVYQVFSRKLIRLLLDASLGDLAVRCAGKGPTPVLMEGSLFGERTFEWLAKILEQPESSLFFHQSEASCGQLTEKALRQAVDELKCRCGTGMDDWSWGKLHRMTLSHVLGQVKPLDRFFNRGPYPVGGDFNTLWATGASYHDLELEVVVGPPFRFIADLGNMDNCLGLLAPGQSGQPASPHYSDQLRAWFNGNYHPMWFNRQDVLRAARSVLKMLPRTA